MRGSIILDLVWYNVLLEPYYGDIHNMHTKLTCRQT